MVRLLRVISVKIVHKGNVMRKIKTYLLNKPEQLCGNCMLGYVCRAYKCSCSKHRFWSFIKKIIAR